MSADTIECYFKLSDNQITQFDQLLPLYSDWNTRINVISRKDIDHLYERHVLHSLAIAKVLQFKPGSKVLDLGTGGGFPGIPLSILFPDTDFLLIDGTRKKIRVVREVATTLGLRNITATQIRAEEFRGMTFDFVVSRAVASLDKLIAWSRRLLSPRHQHALPNGLLALKGGNLQEEFRSLPKGEYTEQYAISRFFPSPYFSEKYVVYVQG